MNYKIRKITKEDCPSVAHVVTITWNETYKGIVPDEFLNGLYENEEKRAINTYNRFDAKEQEHQYVIEINNEVSGFVNVGDSDEEGYGEIHALYILSKYKGLGLGKELFNTGINELKSMGYTKMIIGCLDGNPTNEFYKHMGGELRRQRIFEKLGLPENVYYFDNI